jgi:predicted lipase
MDDKLDLILSEIQKLNKRMDKIEQSLSIEDEQIKPKEVDNLQIGLTNVDVDTKEIIKMLNQLGYKLDISMLIDNACEQLGLKEEFNQFQRAKAMSVSDKKLHSLKSSGVDLGAYLDMLESD